MASSEGSCGYCCNPLDELVDPRLLPCGHVFCYGCLVAHFNMTSQLICIFCRKEYKGIEIGNLKPCHARKQVPSCNVCKADAEKYCLQCEKNLCKDHLKLHDDYNTSMKVSHSLVPAGANQKTPVKEKKLFCTDHTAEEIRRACSTCYKLLCVECIALNNCSSSKKGHSIEKVEELSGKLRKTLTQLTSELYNKSLFHDDLEKQANAILHQMQLECNEGKALVDKVTKQQVNELEQKASNLKSEMDMMYQNSKQLVKGYSSELLTSKSKLDDVRQEVHSVSHLESDFEVICQYSVNVTKAKSFISAAIKDLSLPTRKIEQLGSKNRELEVQMSSLSTVKVIEPSKFAAGCTTGLEKVDLKKLIRQATESKLLSSSAANYSCVLWLSDKTLACASGYKIDILDKSLKCMKSFNLANSQFGNGHSITALVQHGQFYFVLYRLNNVICAQGYSTTWNLKANSQKLAVGCFSSILNDTILVIGKQCESCCLYDVFGYCKMQLQLPARSITGAQLVQHDAFVVWNFEKGTADMIKYDPIQNVAYHSFLGCNQRTVENGWTCSGLQHPLGLCTDEKGSIYVLSSGQQNKITLYILSSKGEKMKELVIVEQSQTNFSFNSMSIMNGTLAISSSSGLALYKLDSLD